MLENKKIGLFITGGIASYKMAEFTRQLIRKGAQVRVVMSQSAQEFITPLTLQILTKHHVLVDIFDEHDPTSVQHIELADWCDLAIVAPATANIFAKMANGLADDIVSSVLLAVHCPRLIVPAMNTNMYHNPATQRNLTQLAADGYTVMEPDTGFLAEGYVGKGRLPELERILEKAEMVLAQTELPQVLAGKKVLVTAGGTIERIDPVRYISNDSSGKMGYAMARAATWLGAQVQLVSTNKNLTLPLGIGVTYVESAKDMQTAVEAAFEGLDFVVKAAAVSDYRVANSHQEKMKKSDTGDERTIELVENPDILAGLGARKTHQTLIGFAAETQNLLEYASAKLEKKNADWIIANDVSQAGAGFNVDTNRVTILGKHNEKRALEQLSKLETALEVWKTITGLTKA
ncbi:bifunctional phosphopantothenoylcysteine decarboxylase/phosphopantothenate--cysteine ligase CoaBC [Fundicoccus sp. Sow4_F4]|uniref:bifunctional phosphopantothenoylcysteine decarboxylase/phosphopantothenate--cysteine ligase CoaBC n=1 Tax=Fundicoccus sp. Sow4_F4 TaxID=3438783 RepID=UPI003F8E1069